MKEKRFELTIVGQGFSSNIHSSAETHLQVLDKEIDYRKTFARGVGELPFYARIVDAGIKLPPVVIRS